VAESAGIIGRSIHPHSRKQPGRNTGILGRVNESPVLRQAVRADVPSLAALMRQSVLDVFPHFHDERETQAAARYLTEPDVALIDDGTYFVHEVGGELVACGGWSKRAKLYTGSGAAPTDDRLLDPATEPARVRAMFVRSDWTRRGLGRAILARSVAAARDAGFTTLELMATMPGVPLYRSFGFREVRRVGVPLPNGVVLAGMAMDRPVLLER
jgi:GNAT superfamily N-acetyltransferase